MEPNLNNFAPNKEEPEVEKKIIFTDENIDAQDDDDDKHPYNTTFEHIYKQSSELKSTHNIKEIADEYDYCLVFPLERGSADHLTSFGREAINKIKRLGFEIFAFTSHSEQEVYVLIRAPLLKLRNFADEINFKLQLDPNVAQEMMESGDVEEKIKGVVIPHNEEITKLRPYEFIHGMYSLKVPEKLYYKKLGEENPFHEGIRQRLTVILLESSPTDGSEPFTLQRYINTKDIIAAYPLHNPASLAILKSSWLVFKQLPWTLPLFDIKEYFGNKIALFYYFLGHYSLWLMIPAFIGIPLQIAVYSTDNYSAPYIPGFSFFISMWSICMLEYWKRKEKTIAMEWGMSSYESTEVDRSEFKGEKVKSVITGQEMKFFPSSQRTRNVSVSLFVVFCLILLVIGVVVGIYVIRFTLAANGTVSEANSQNIASILNAVLIQTLNFLYGELVKILVDFENHRTETQYEDSMITKVVLFQFVNSYASFYYLAFIGQLFGDCHADTCMTSLSSNLGIVLGTNIAVSLFLPVLLPMFTSQRKLKYVLWEYGNVLVRPEREYYLEKYDVRRAGITNFAQVAVQFGYMALFVSALPMAAIFLFISNFVITKVKAWELLYVYKRPMVYGAQDIGTWQSVFTFLTIASVMTNAGLTVFTMTTFDKYSTVTRYWIYIIFHFICFGCQIALQEAIPDIPETVQIQLDRQEFIISKIIEHVEDDPDFEKVDNNNPVPVTIYPYRLEVTTSYYNNQLTKKKRRGSYGGGARVKPGNAYDIS